MKNKAKNKKIPSTQKNLYIAALRNNVVILKDGSLRAVINVNSVNFGLKSEDEQMGLVNNYVAFLNSLKYPLQIVIQSRKFNISSYMQELKAQESKQMNDLLRKQIVEYSEFVKDLIEMGDIMTKKFYVVIPLSGKDDMEQKGFFTRFAEVFKPAVKITLSQSNFLKKHRKLMLRVNNVMSGLAGMGLKAELLTTKDLIKLYYNSYNPHGDVDRPEVDDMTKLRYDIV